jgi:hypothetical protein
MLQENKRVTIAIASEYYRTLGYGALLDQGINHIYTPKGSLSSAFPASIYTASKCENNYNLPLIWSDLNSIIFLSSIIHCKLTVHFCVVERYGWQVKILKDPLASSKFSDGFAEGLSHSFTYLDNDTREQILNLADTNSIPSQKHLQMITKTSLESSSANKGTTVRPEVAGNEMIEEYGQFPMPSSFMEHTELPGSWNIVADVEQRDIIFRVSDMTIVYVILTWWTLLK